MEDEGMKERIRVGRMMMRTRIKEDEEVERRE